MQVVRDKRQAGAEPGQAQAQRLIPINHPVSLNTGDNVSNPPSINHNQPTQLIKLLKGESLKILTANDPLQAIF